MPAPDFACPRCDAVLEDLTCSACRLTFPALDGVPFLMADPDDALSDWRNRWTLAHAELDAERNLARNAGAVSTATQARLDALAAGLDAQKTALDRVLGPLAVAKGVAKETQLGLKTRLPNHHGVLSYAQNITRDWAWGAAENEAAANAVAPLVPQGARVLVLGCGAGRLAYDLHRMRTPSVTVALDTNPLLALVGHALSAGQTLSFVEFPVAPVGAPAIEHALTAPEPVTGLQFVIADALRAPFLDRAFDVVITPWFIDVVDCPLVELLPHINRLLVDGGRWINHGSLAFGTQTPAENLTLPEVEALLPEAGFAPLVAEATTMPYMDSPASRHGRVENVLTWHADKVAHTRPAARHQHLPDWIVTGKVPVPLSPSFQTQATTTRVHAFIMSLIDGKRTADEMAKELEARRLMPLKEAQVAIRGFLTTMHAESKAPR